MFLISGQWPNNLKWLPFTPNNPSTKLFEGLFQGGHEFIALPLPIYDHEDTMTIVTPKFGMGASVLRVEDQTFITGAGRYTDDIAPEGLLHGFVLRSPVANGSFKIGSTDAAKQAPGVHLVLTGADLGHLGDLRSSVMQKQPDGSRAPTRDIPILCRDRVRHVGDAVAFIVADTRALAQDAAELIEVDYDSEEAAAVTATALDKGTPLVWPELGTNQAFLYELGDKKKTAAAFAKAAHVVGIKFMNNRLVCNYMEARSAIGEWKPDEDRYVLTSGSQGVHGMRDVITPEGVQDRAGEAAGHHSRCRRRLWTERLRVP